MPDETTTETTDESLTTEETTSADEATVDEAVEGGAEAAASDDEDAELTPEQKADAEKKARIDARAKAAEEAEKRAAEAREKRRAEQRERERIAKIEHRERELELLTTQARDIVEELRVTKQRVLAGGKSALDALGIDLGAIIREDVEGNSPEAIAKRAEERAARLEKQIEEERRAMQMQRAEAEKAASRRAFYQRVDAHAEDYPYASSVSSRLLSQLSDEAAHEFRREVGRWPTFDELLPRVDDKARDEQEDVKMRSAKRARPGTQPSDGETTPRESNGQPASPPANRTLNGVVAGMKAKPPRQMTEEEIDEWARQELRRARAADRKAEAG